MAAAAATRRRRWSRRSAVSSSSAAARLLFFFFAAAAAAATTTLLALSARGDGNGFGFGPVANAAPTPDCQPSLYARMRLDPELSDCASLLEAVGYRSSLEDERGGGVGVTVLAPTNAALRAPLPRSSGSGNGGGGNGGSSKSFNSSLALFSSVPAAARAAIGGHVLRGAIRDPSSSELAQGRKWLRTLATAKRPGTADRGLGVTVVGASSPGPVFLLRSDTGATARATFVPAKCGDALMKLDGVLWPYKL